MQSPQTGEHTGGYQAEGGAMLQHIVRQDGAGDWLLFAAPGCPRPLLFTSGYGNKWLGGPGAQDWSAVVDEAGTSVSLRSGLHFFAMQPQAQQQPPQAEQPQAQQQQPQQQQQQAPAATDSLPTACLDAMVGIGRGTCIHQSSTQSAPFSHPRPFT